MFGTRKLAGPEEEAGAVGNSGHTSVLNGMSEEEKRRLAQRSKVRPQESFYSSYNCIYLTLLFFILIYIFTQLYGKSRRVLVEG